LEWWILALLCIVFLIAALWFYPLTLRLRASEGKLRLYWLPKIFMAYARPVPIPVKRLLAKNKRGKKKKALRLLFRLARAVHLRKLWFDFLLMNPGISRFDGECIISLRLCDIIRKSLRRKWRRIWRNRYVWRT